MSHMSKSSNIIDLVEVIAATLALHLPWLHEALKEFKAPHSKMSCYVNKLMALFHVSFVTL
eukprot:scaffold39502_cov19-Prasinocladus_malaysianus.AAC.1